MRCLPRLPIDIFSEPGVLKDHFMLTDELLLPKSGPYFRGASRWFSDDLPFGGVLTPRIYRSTEQLSLHEESLEHLLRDVTSILPQLYRLLNEAEIERALESAIQDEYGLDIDWDPVIESDVTPQPQHFEGICAHYNLLPTRMIEVTADPNVAKIFSLVNFQSEDNAPPYVQQYVVKSWRDETDFSGRVIRYGWFPASWDDSYIKRVFERGGRGRLSPAELTALQQRSSFVFELNIPARQVQLVHNYARQKLMLGAIRPVRQTAFGVFLGHIEQSHAEQHLLDAGSNAPLQVVGIYAYHPALYPLAPSPFRSWKDLPASYVLGENSRRSGTGEGLSLIEGPWGHKHVPPDYLVEVDTLDITLHHLHEGLLSPLYMGNTAQRQEAQDFFRRSLTRLFPVNEHEWFNAVLQRLKDTIHRAGGLWLDRT